MNAIVVTIPRQKLSEVAEEEARVKAAIGRGETGWHYYWTLPSFPAREHVERCYFAWRGAVRAWHEVLGFDDVDGRPAVLLDAEIHELEPTRPMTGFQGFRYIDPHEDW